jgi:hypothetical protein
MNTRRLLLPAIFTVAAAVPVSAAMEPEIALQVTPSSIEVEFGKGFPVTVVRSWSRDLVPEEWPEDALAPLVAQLVETKRNERDGRVEETRRYRCYAFSVGDVTVPAPVFRATHRGDDTPRAAFGESFSLRVRMALDPDAPGPVELPCDLMGEPEPPAGGIPWWASGIVLAAALVLLISVLRRAIRKPEPVPAVAPPPPDPPDVRALARLHRLRERSPHGREEVDSFHVEAAALMRDYVWKRFSARVTARTTQELLAATWATRTLGAEPRKRLSEYFTQCDHVKFGRYSPGPKARDRLLDTGEEFLLETRSRIPASRSVASPSAGGDAG